LRASTQDVRDKKFSQADKFLAVGILTFAPPVVFKADANSDADQSYTVKKRKKRGKAPKVPYPLHLRQIC